MSKRQQIMDEVDKVLRNIKTINGYQTDAGYNVFAWRQEPLQMSELPAIVYSDRLIERREGSIGTFRWVLRITLQCAVAAGADTAKEMRKLIEDIIKAIGVGAETRWNNLAQDTVLFTDSEMGIEREGVTIGEALISFDIVYDSGRWEV
jgi:hypothetical protein